MGQFSRAFFQRSAKEQHTKWEAKNKKAKKRERTAKYKTTIGVHAPCAARTTSLMVNCWPCDTNMAKEWPAHETGVKHQNVLLLILLLIPLPIWSQKTVAH